MALSVRHLHSLGPDSPGSKYESPALVAPVVSHPLELLAVYIFCAGVCWPERTLERIAFLAEGDSVMCSKALRGHISYVTCDGPE